MIRTFQIVGPVFLTFGSATMAKQRIPLSGATSAESAGSLVFSREQIRALDAAAVAELGIPGLLLMENAARGVADVLMARFGMADAGHAARLPPVVIVCGPGNNGGDGLALCRLLAAWQMESRVLLLTADKRLSADAASNRAFLQRCHISVQEPVVEMMVDQLVGLSADSLIVDCLLGTGVQGAPQAPFSDVIAAMNDSAATVVSVDVPSGLDCETGTAVGACVRAAVTVSFVGLKTGYMSASAAACLGDVEIVPIGLPWSWVTAFHAR